MITITGHMDAGSCCTVTYTTGGATQLTMTAFAGSPSTVDGVMYRLVWVGAGAEDFYHQHGAGLTVGRRLLVNGSNPRPLIDRGDVCIMLDVLDIQILSRGAGEATRAPAPTTNTPKVTTRTLPMWPWPNRAVDKVWWVDHEVGA